MFTLYKLSFSSGKSYIGQTINNFKRRLNQHKLSASYGSKLAVHGAWRKYGDPVAEIIGKYNSQEELHKAEIDAIKDLNTLVPNGYNLGYGGETAPSKNPDVAKKISEKAKGRKVSEEAKELLRITSKLNWQDDSYREKVISAVRESWTYENRKKRSELSKSQWEKRKADGWTMPESQREKLKGRVFSEESRKKMSDAAKGKPKSPQSKETCKKLSEKTTEKWKDVEHSSKRSAAIRNAWTPEKRAVMAAKAAELWKDPVVRERRAAAKAASKLKRLANI